MNNPLVAVIMGSKSDWETMKHCCDQLKALSIPYHTQIISAHRTPDLLFEFAENADKQKFEIIIAGAGGAAHLPGMVAAKTHLPVLGVPVQSHSFNGLDSLLSIVQMPAGVPVATFAVGKAGAINAALFAGALLGLKYPDIQNALTQHRTQQTTNIMSNLDPECE